MKKLIEIINIWLDAEKLLLQSSLKGSFTNGYHKGYIRGLDMAKELLIEYNKNPPPK